METLTQEGKRFVMSAAKPRHHPGVPPVTGIITLNAYTDKGKPTKKGGKRRIICQARIFFAM